MDQQVASGLLWWQAFLACIVGHLIASAVMIANGRSGSMYYIGYPVQVRSSFGMWGSYWPVFSRSILALVWFSVQSYFLGQFLDLCFMCVFGSGWTNLHNQLPISADITTRGFVAYFLGWLVQLPFCFIRPHRIVSSPSLFSVLQLYSI
jgi:nucleobase:cation symporter-1, NCS1 family